jgi:hypothetical protein
MDYVKNKPQARRFVAAHDLVAQEYRSKVQGQPGMCYVGKTFMGALGLGVLGHGRGLVAAVNNYIDRMEGRVEDPRDKL